MYQTVNYKPCPLNYAETRKTLNFHKYILNMDIPFIMRLIYLKIAVHIIKTHLEGIVSQKFDIGLSFNLVSFRRGGGTF